MSFPYSDPPRRSKGYLIAYAVALLACASGLLAWIVVIWWLVEQL